MTERETPMDDEAADRISAAAEKDPDSPTAASGFDERAKDAADRALAGAGVDVVARSGARSVWRAV